VSSASSKRALYAALAGNGLIALTKFGAAAWTGSNALLSEAFHSSVDIINQLLLLLGLARAARPADDDHPFGYGKELYFWVFVVALLVFALGGGLSLYEGVRGLLHPAPVEDALVGYVVLGLALVFESGSWWVAFQEFRRQKGSASMVEAIRGTKDPTIMAVLFEDSAAILGLVVALCGLIASQALGLPEADAIAAIIIGLILCAAAVVLALESKSLLIGESLEPALRRQVKALIEAHPAVEGVGTLLSLHLGPSDVVLGVAVDFRDQLSAGAVEQAIAELDQTVRTAVPAIRHLFIEASRLGASTGASGGGALS